MTQPRHTEIAVIGSGIAGIATAYQLCAEFGKSSVTLVDSRQPMSFTSAQTGDNYRNWWPHPVMVEFMNFSIDLMEKMAAESSNVLEMTRGGYVVATRRPEVDVLLREIRNANCGAAAELIRIHDRASSTTYAGPDSSDWRTAPDGVDVISNRQVIRDHFPSFSDDISNVLHIRRAGQINSQRMGQYMLSRIKDAGGTRLTGQVRSIKRQDCFDLAVTVGGETHRISAEVVINAAGPFAAEVAALLDVDLPIENVYQQKISFDDRLAAVPRQLPFSIDIDEQELAWTSEERQMIADDPQRSWLAGSLPGGIHCRPEGGIRSSKVKLGWAYNRTPSQPREEPANDPNLDPSFPEIVLRGAAALNPGLRGYVDATPGGIAHYGGYYPMTPENWPIIGPMGVDGAFVVGALSGFGTMSGCAAGALCAAWACNQALPAYAAQLSLDRYRDRELMTEIENSVNKGIL